MIKTKPNKNTHLPSELCVLMAAQIEQELLPKRSPKIQGADIAGWTMFSDQLGGDFFDYHNFHGVCCQSETQLNIIVGDACGHGLSSALLMTSARSYLRARAMQSGKLDQVVTDVNRLLYMDIQKNSHFVTLFYASIFGAENKIEWVRAGHPPALLFDPIEDTYISLYGKGVALGVDPEYMYQSNSRTNIPDGAIMLIGSDGLWEMESSVDGSSCRKTLTDLVREHQHEKAETIAQEVKQQIKICCDTHSPQDDLTLVVAKFIKE